MAKAQAPVRLQEDLMAAATVAAKRQHRSAAEQIEYWADLGRNIADTLQPNSLLAVASGLATLKVEPVIAPHIDPDDVFAALEQERAQGNLAAECSRKCHGSA